MMRAGTRNGCLRSLSSDGKLPLSGGQQTRQAEAGEQKRAGLRDDLAVRSTSAPRPNIDALVKAAAVREPGAAE